MEAADCFRAVYANPGDAGARQVLADVLLEAGDPRGELIALQLQHRRSRKAQLKLERLLARHLTDFLGPLAGVVSPRGQVWEDGFLVECRATLTGTLVDEPSLATLRRLELQNRDGEVPLELLGPHVASLREVTGLPRAAVVPVFTHARPLPFQSVGVEGQRSAEPWTTHELDALRSARALPALRQLSIAMARFDLEGLEWLWTAPSFARLRTVELGLSRVAIDLGALRDRLVLLDEVPDTLVLRGRQLELRLKPTDRWRTLHLLLHAPLTEPVRHDAALMLESLPAEGLSRLDVSSDFPVTRDALARLKALVKRFPRLAPVRWPSSC
ncbi:MAG: hypothetical protein IAE78_26470 [Myxococcus sp.]|nr:hypothetical protein [Myxococcus sp.]